jgi:hypothetical protein
MTKRSRIRAFGFAALLVLAGAAGAALFSGTLGQVLALVLIGIGLVIATSLVFLEVGLSEDRDRAREERGRKAEAAQLRPRSRLGRMRGRSRRIR